KAAGMRMTGRSLDDEIAEVEARLAQHRAQLRLFVGDVRSRFSARGTVPLAMGVALAAGFVAARLARRKRPAPAPAASRSGKVLSALAGAIVPVVLARVQHAAVQWLAERMRARDATKRASPAREGR